MTSVPLDHLETNDENLSDDDNDKSSLSSASDSSNDCPFSAEICTKLSAAFAKATGIDIEVAVHLLKEYGWNIDQALRATYEAKEHAQSMVNTKQDWKKTGDKYFKILSWNADASDTDEEDLNDLIQQRMETMIEILLREKPDVILLQEIGTFALTLIITCLSALYDDESIQTDSLNYVSIFTRKSTMKKAKVLVINNQNNWNMLKVETEYKNSIKLDLFNAIIDENTSSFCFEQINQSNTNHPVLCGITSKITNATDHLESGNLVDIWEVTDQQLEKNYTYDPVMNSSISSREKPRRCDRLFFRSTTSTAEKFKPVHMELEGIEHIKTSDTIFPSTHWALQSYFDVDI
ncbi:unnamed protein product [Adineta ricciae]|uniref:Uncharacterized protein n=1 Tax=Adineta ricciae TaxID=249248 RepID=A0A814M4U1_ADIRI|nr:unnamed protein product [Adineta ricciae]CAF1075326.1 unnamed protein product [Adineta ricciae]